MKLDNCQMKLNRADTISPDIMHRPGLSQVEFRFRGVHCQDLSGFTSISQAQQQLAIGKKGFFDQIQLQKEKHLESYRTQMNPLIARDLAVVNMPCVRINANKAARNLHNKRIESENKKMQMKSVDVSKYINTNKKHESMRATDMFQPVSAHHVFSKDNCQLRTLYSTFVKQDQPPIRTFNSPVHPVTVTTGAEWATPNEVSLRSSFSLTRNTPSNIQCQRVSHLEKVGTRYSKTADGKRVRVVSVDSNSLASKVFAEGSVPRALKVKPELQLMHCKGQEEVVQVGFVAKPSEDIPKNRLTEKLTRGIQSFVQRMQKREGLRVDIQVIPMQTDYLPQAREYGTLTACGNQAFLIGGNGFQTISEISVANVSYDSLKWSKVNYTSDLAIAGRQMHSCVAWRHCLYIFGGCFSFNRKRGQRESTNQILELDTKTKVVTVIRTIGASVGVRKQHQSVAFKNSMVVFGGTTDMDQPHSDMLVYNFEDREWLKLKFKGYHGNFFYQGSVCAVILTKKPDAGTRKSDIVKEGIYYFGGKIAGGKLNDNKLHYFRPLTVDSKVVSGEFLNVKAQGNPPCARFGHQMQFLPMKNALIVTGGRNDELCTQGQSPILNDLHMFLLDQKVWINVKFSNQSNRLQRIYNASMTLVTDNESFEKIILFGGIQNNIGKQTQEGSSQIVSSLTNRTYSITINNIQATGPLFQDLLNQ